MADECEKKRKIILRFHISSRQTKKKRIDSNEELSGYVIIFIPKMRHFCRAKNCLNIYDNLSKVGGEGTHAEVHLTVKIDLSI